MAWGYKEHHDCYWYGELIDMSATISFCSYDTNHLYDCPCQVKKEEPDYICEHYINKKKADELLRREFNK